MGNCQAAEISAVVIQHPGGRIERLYWPTTAGDVMKANPGHHVAILTLCIAQQKKTSDNENTEVDRTVRFTRVRLLKPKDMLLMGQVYRLVSSQEVSKALKARKLEKMKKQRQPAEDSGVAEEQKAEERARMEPRRPENQETDRPATAGRARQWRPKLQSISEGMG